MPAPRWRPWIAPPCWPAGWWTASREFPWTAPSSRLPGLAGISAPSRGGSNPRGGGDPNAGLVRLEQRDGQYETITGADGRFLFCRVPVGPSVVVETAVADRVVEPETLVLEEAGRPEFMTVYIRN